jgi:hypothetical protein
MPIREPLADMLYTSGNDDRPRVQHYLQHYANVAMIPPKSNRAPARTNRDGVWRVTAAPMASPR